MLLGPSGLLLVQKKKQGSQEQINQIVHTESKRRKENPPFNQKEMKKVQERLVRSECKLHMRWNLGSACAWLHPD
jgi:hypothetical protein